VPLHYCTRFLAYNFLLAGKKKFSYRKSCPQKKHLIILVFTGKQGYERSDNEIRVTVKVLAINCIINSIQLCPIVYFLPLSPTQVEPDETEKQQKISDVSLYSRHHDPLLRGSTYLLIGHFLRQILRVDHGVWVNQDLRMEELITILNSGLLDQSNIGVKYALSGLSECLVPILRSRDGASFLGELFENLFAITSNPYWLVKVSQSDLICKYFWIVLNSYLEVVDSFSKG